MAITFYWARLLEGNSVYCLLLGYLSARLLEGSSYVTYLSTVVCGTQLANVFPLTKNSVQNSWIKVFMFFWNCISWYIVFNWKWCYGTTFKVGSDHYLASLWLYYLFHGFLLLSWSSAWSGTISKCIDTVSVFLLIPVVGVVLGVVWGSLNYNLESWQPASRFVVCICCSFFSSKFSIPANKISNPWPWFFVQSNMAITVICRCFE